MNHSWLVSILLGLCTVGTAHGQTPGTLNCETNTACLALYEQAQRHSKDGHPEDALRLYKLAYEVQADPRLLYSIGRVLHKQGQAAEAVLYYGRFLDSEVDDPEQKDKARDYQAQANRLSATQALKGTPSVTKSAPAMTTATSANLRTILLPVTTPTPKRNVGYRIGWITSGILASVFLTTAIPFLILSPRDGQPTCTDRPANQCPTVYHDNLVTGLGLLSGAIATTTTFGALLYLDRRDRQRSQAKVTIFHLPIAHGAGLGALARF